MDGKDCKVIDGFCNSRALEDYLDSPEFRDLSQDCFDTDTFQDVEGFEGFGVVIHFCMSEVECTVDEALK